MGTVFSVEGVEIVLMLEVVGVDVAAFGGGVGLDVVGELHNVQRDVRLGQDLLGHLQDLGVRRRGCPHPDGGAGQRGVVDVGVKAVAGKGGAFAGSRLRAGGGRSGRAAADQAQGEGDGQQAADEFLFHGVFSFDSGFRVHSAPGRRTGTCLTFAHRAAGIGDLFSCRFLLTAGDNKKAAGRFRRPAASVPQLMQRNAGKGKHAQVAEANCTCTSSCHHGVRYRS